MGKSDLLSLIPAVIYKAKAKIDGGKVLIERVEFVNDWIEKMTGWTPEEIRRDPNWWQSNLHEEDRDKAVAECRRLLEGGEWITRSYRFRKKEGDYLYIHDSLAVTGVEGDVLEVVGVWEDLSFQRQYYEFFNGVDKAPSIGVIIYRETIVYANEVAIRFFNYPVEELYRLNVHDLVTEDFREFTYQTIQRRLKGEQFERVYVDLPVVTKEGYIRDVCVFTRTIQWEGKPAGFVIFFDVTKRKKYERLFSILRDVNQLMISTVEKEDLLENLCRILIDKAGFRMAWVGMVDEESGDVIPISVHGLNEGYVENLRINIRADHESGKGPTATALREGKVAVNPDTRTNPSVMPWKEEMLKRGFLSSCAIPISVNGKPMYVLNIYSSVPYLFTDEELELLREIQQDISFALEKIEKERFIKIVNTAVEKGHEWVLITDREGKILYVNRAVEEISEYSADELVGKNPRIFKSGYHDRDFYRELWDTITRGNTFKAVFVNRKKSGGIFYLDQSIVPVSLGDGEIRFVALGKDITFQKHLEDTITRLKYIDVITDLPNRDGFLSMAQSAIDRDRSSRHIMFIIDLREFTGINQVYGTATGDEILRVISSVLRETLFKRDVVGRIGADEFGILVSGIHEKDITLVLEKIFSSVTRPFEVKGKTIRVSINIGASLYPRDGKSAKEIFERASLALSFARQEGENTYRFFSEEINAMVSGYLEKREALERAIRENRFHVYFQPFYYTGSNIVAGLEALMRLEDEEGNIHLPSEFIYTLERTGLIIDLEKSLLDRIRKFLGEVNKKVPVAVNISPKSFKSEDFVDMVVSVASEVGENLILEITERLFVENPDYTRGFLERVRSAGAKVTIDDFGTGYSSLSYLESLPVDIMKLDMSFVKKIVSNPKTLAIVEMVIGLARKLNLKTIAEGVESEQQLKILERLRCDMVQGYLLSYPMPEDKARALLL